MKCDGLAVAGSWRTSTVAIKVITHNATLSRKVDTLRESLVGISIQHPNVVRANFSHSTSSYISRSDRAFRRI